MAPKAAGARPRASIDQKFRGAGHAKAVRKSTDAFQSHEDEDEDEPRPTVSITDVDASKQLLTSIYKTCADLEGLNIWERLSALHTLGVHVKGAETPFCTIVARGKAPGSERRAQGPMYIEESLPGINISPALYYGALYACTCVKGSVVPSNDVAAAASTRVAGGHAGHGGKVVKRMGAEEAERERAAEEERMGRIRTKTRKAKAKPERVLGEGIEARTGGSSFGVPMVPPEGVLRVSWRKDGWIGEVRPREIQELQSMGVPMPPEDRMIPVIDFQAPAETDEAGKALPEHCSTAPLVFLPSPGDLEFLEVTLLALLKLARESDVLAHVSLGMEADQEVAHKYWDRKAAEGLRKNAVNALRTGQDHKASMTHRLSMGIFGAAPTRAQPPRRSRHAKSGKPTGAEADGAGNAVRSAPAPTVLPPLNRDASRGKLQAIGKKNSGRFGPPSGVHLHARGGMTGSLVSLPSLPSQAHKSVLQGGAARHRTDSAEVVGMDQWSVMGVREDIRPFRATVSVTRWDGKKVKVQLCYPPTLLSPEEQPFGLYKEPFRIDYDTELGTMVKSMAVSTSSLPNAYHLGIATCSHCGVTMLATHAIQCPSCQSANYCSEKCMSQHAMSTHHTYACQSLLRASQEKAARALAAEAMPRWEFFAGDVPSLHFWLERCGLISPGSVWAALDPSSFPKACVRELALKASSPVLDYSDDEEDGAMLDDLSRDACILDTFCTHTHPGQICTNTALFCRLSATESINANGPPSNEPSTAPTEAGHEDVRNGDEDGARDTKAGASAEGEGHGAIGDGTAALVEADWGAGLGSRPGMTPKDWSRVPLCDPGEVAVLETWGDWLRLREVPLSSPTPVAMTHALTLIHMLRMCVSASALDLKTILQAHKATQTERLCVHVIGTRWQVFVEPALWTELPVLLPGLPTELHVFSPIAPPCIHGERLLAKGITVHIWGSLYSSAATASSLADEAIPRPDVIVALNAFDPLAPSVQVQSADASSPHANWWLHELKHARSCGAPLVFTAPTWPPVLGGTEAGMSPDAVPGYESVAVNPFRSPLVESLQHCMVPYVSNGWIFRSRMRPARKVNRRTTMLSRMSRAAPAEKQAPKGMLGAQRLAPIRMAKAHDFKGAGEADSTPPRSLAPL